MASRGGCDVLKRLIFNDLGYMTEDGFFIGMIHATKDPLVLMNITIELGNMERKDHGIWIV